MVTTTCRYVAETVPSRNLVATKSGAWTIMVVHMKSDIEIVKAEAQQVLDELSAESLIPFKLEAREVYPIGTEELIIRFHDSRLRSIDISWKQGESFKAVFRVAMLERVARLGGPFSKPKLIRTIGFAH